MPEESSAPSQVRLDVVDEVAVLRIDRPKLNALNTEIQDRLRDLAADCTSRDDIAAVVLTGGDRVFAAGADIKEMMHLSHSEMLSRASDLQGAFTAVAQIPKPVVAAVNGYALGGGCELALCADIRVASVDATFGQPEIKLGIIPGAGGTQRLTRLVGPAQAKELIFTGRSLDAAEALVIGLVDQVVPAPEVIPTAMAWARQFVGGPTLALQAAKQCIDQGIGQDLDTALGIERVQFAELFGTADRLIGMKHFAARGAGKAPFVGR